VELVISVSENVNYVEDISEQKYVVCIEEHSILNV